MPVRNRRGRVREEFPAQVHLGSDGIGQIVVLDLTRDEVREVVDSFDAPKRSDVENFFAIG